LREKWGLDKVKFKFLNEHSQKYFENHRKNFGLSFIISRGILGLSLYF